MPNPTFDDQAMLAVSTWGKCILEKILGYKVAKGNFTALGLGKSSRNVELVRRLT